MQYGANLALRALVEAGPVAVEGHPPAKLYSLNRRHLAATGVEALASVGERLIEAIRTHLATWEIPPRGAWVFSSASRSDGGETSDIEVLVLRPDEIGDADPDWLGQVARFARM